HSHSGQWTLPCPAGAGFGAQRRSERTLPADSRAQRHRRAEASHTRGAVWQLAGNRPGAQTWGKSDRQRSPDGLPRQPGQAQGGANSRPLSTGSGRHGRTSDNGRATAADRTGDQPCNPSDHGGPAVKIAHFFIDRPVFAMVISIVTIIAGSIAAMTLPVS